MQAFRLPESSYEAGASLFGLVAGGVPLSGTRLHCGSCLRCWRGLACLRLVRRGRRARLHVAAHRSRGRASRSGGG